jgi:starch synthase (maltosyl-transferring)
MANRIIRGWEHGSGQVRTIIRNVYPDIEGGRFAIKRVVGEAVNVWADVLADGHDIVCASLLYRYGADGSWKETRAVPIGDDRWHATFNVDRAGTWYYRFTGWTDRALYWQYGLAKKADAGLDVRVELLEGLEFIDHLEKISEEGEKAFLKQCTTAFRNAKDQSAGIALGRSPELKALFEKYPHRPFQAFSDHEYAVCVDREKAAFSTWYEFFPRSASRTKGKHGNFKDCIDLLPRIAALGFDTLYFPPIHPIGRVNRKGKNNSPVAGNGDVGSCWGIGAKEGGHKDILPELGTLDEFRDLVRAAAEFGIEIAMDYALQAAPDHPWVKENPQWFRQRQDGSIQYAENPPKKYQDIYPINFETPDWENMWEHFRDVLLFWIDQGVSIFRVDNPHTKPFGFWAWMIERVKEKHPDVLFLSEAFSRPAVMYELGRAGFTQSYTYFTWRNTKQELEDYLGELTTGPVSETFRPNFWPNTPDILPFPLQHAEESVFMIRYFLAATLSSNCGVYGPVYELMVSEPVDGKEEYLHSEKYEIGHWDWDTSNKVTDVYRKVNAARKKYRALQRTNNIEFLHISSEQMIAYLKTGDDGSKVVSVVSLDPSNRTSAILHLHPDQLGCSWEDGMAIRDVMSGRKYNWYGEAHHIELEPSAPFHLFVLER